MKALKIISFAAISFLTYEAAAQQTDPKDINMEMFKNMPPEQLKGMIKMAINSLPADKKAEIEESLNAMELKEPKPDTVLYKNKSIVFIPIAHAGQPEFYSSLTSMVKNYKQNGYTVYYEQIKKNEELSKEENDTLRYKFRRMMGGEPTRQTYSIIKRFFPDIVVQPEYNELGITDSDKNIDVTMSDMVKAFSNKYGEISLTKCDFETPLGTLMYTCVRPTHDIMPIILDYRNEFVAENLKTTIDQKIVVIYGAKHIPGIKSLLK